MGKHCQEGDSSCFRDLPGSLHGPSRSLFPCQALEKQQKQSSRGSLEMRHPTSPAVESKPYKNRV